MVDHIAVGVEAVGVQLDDRNGDVGAVVGDSLVVGQKIVEDEALGQGAGAVLEPLDVMELDLVAENIDALLQRLDQIGLVLIVLREGGDGQVQNFLQGGGKNGEFLQSLTGEVELLGVELGGALRDVDGVIGDALVIAEGVQILGDVFVLVLAQLVGVELDQIGAQPVLIAVDQVLRLFDGLFLFFSSLKSLNSSREASRFSWASFAMVLTARRLCSTARAGCCRKRSSRRSRSS